MRSELYTVAEVAQMITAGKKLLLAGDEHLLAALPAGDWIGGTTPYFMANHHGLFTKQKIFVTELPSCVAQTQITTYDAAGVAQCYNDAPAHGFSFIIIPASCSTHFAFALNAPDFENFAMRPLIGWIAGVHLNEIWKVQPKVYAGPDSRELTDGAVIMHVSLPPDKLADIGITNMFEQGDGDAISFPASGFSAREALVNGTRVNFRDYIQEQRLDMKLPLVSDYSGTMVNVSFMENIGPHGEINFYAPVFSGVEYRHAKPVGNYIEQFIKSTSGALGVQFIVSCNCLLNYVYSGFKSSEALYTSGPFTFGEIAYQLLNQTMIYLRIINIPHQG
jgi:hypothetical protein